MEIYSSYFISFKHVISLVAKSITTWTSILASSGHFFVLGLNETT